MKSKTKRYPGTIAKRGESWRVRLCVGGTYHRFTVKGTKVDAQNFAIEKHSALAADHSRAAAGMPGPTRFSALVSDFDKYELQTLAPGAADSYRDSTKVFSVYFVGVLGDPLVRSIQRSHAKSFLEWRRTNRAGAKPGTVSSVSNHTVARDRRVLHRLFNYALDKDLIDANPCARVSAPKADPRTPPILSTVQLEALLAAAAPNPMLSLYILLLAETGLRSDSEALQLQWDDLDFATGFLQVRSAPGRRTKSGKSRAVPLTARLKAALQTHAAQYRLAMYKGKRSSFVFHHLMSNRTAVAGQQIRSIRRPFENAAAAAKLPAGFRRHDLRHRRVTTWLGEGRNVVHVKEAMGHADLKTTMDYTHLVPGHLRSLVDDDPSPTTAALASR